MSIILVALCLRRGRFQFCRFGQILVQFFLNFCTEKLLVVFQFWSLVQFAGFLQFSLWFSVFVNNNASFSAYGFSGFAKEDTLSY